jgi:hypothetical protein
VDVQTAGGPEAGHIASGSASRTERAVLADLMPDPGNVIRRALLATRIIPRWVWSWRCGILLPSIQACSGLWR